jgi:tetratricopeptide (TPR) repeat protein
MSRPHKTIPALVAIFTLSLCLTMAAQTDDNANNQSRTQQRQESAGDLIEQANALTKAGRLSEAIEVYKDAIRLEPEAATAYSNLGFAYTQAGRFAEAVEALQQAIRLKPDNVVTTSNLGNVYLQLSRHAEAIELLDLGNAYSDIGRGAEAIQALKQAIRLKPEMAAARNNLGVVYFKMGQYEEAGRRFKEAVTLDPDFAGAQLDLGVALARLGRYDEASAALQRAVRLRPDDADARYALGNVFLALKDRGASIRQYAVLKNLNPNLARRLYAQLYQGQILRANEK